MKLWSTFSDRDLMLILDFVSKSYPVMVAGNGQVAGDGPGTPRYAARQNIES